MADVRVNTPRLRSARNDRFEYRFYFALIFAFALPAALIGFALGALRDTGEPNKGPVARALSDAQFLAPMIFRG